MNKRLAIQLAIVASVGAALALLDLRAAPGRGGAPTEGAAQVQGPPVQQWVSVEELDRALDLAPAVAAAPLEEPDAPAQEGCVFGNIARHNSEDFEDARWPAGTKWLVSDSFGVQPGLIDDVMWGRVSCEASVGGHALWSVGGGRVGRTLSCAGPDKQYFTTTRPPNRGIRTSLRYSPIDLSNPRVTGLRVTFDYMAKMPANALFIGVGDSEKIENNQILFEGYNTFGSDTGGQWRRGVIVDGEAFNKFAGKPKAILGIFYSDPPPNGEGSPSADVWGTIIDNIHVDVLFNLTPPPCPIESATPTLPIPTTAVPTEVPSETPPPSETPIVIPDTRTPTRTATPHITRIQLPMAMKGYSHAAEYTPPPTAPTPTVTPTFTPTATEPPTATVTPTFTRTPTRTPRPTPTLTPTWTPVPYVEIKIEALRHIRIPAGDSLEFIRITNFGTGSQSMAGWRVLSSPGSPLPAECYFKDGLILEPGMSWELRSGRDASAGVRQDPDLGPSDGEVCKDSYIWDDNFGIGTLYDQNSVIKDKWCYEKNGRYFC